MDTKTALKGLAKWKGLPSYKAEPREDWLIALAIPLLVEKEFQSKCKLLLPEFPLRKGTILNNETMRDKNKSYRVKVTPTYLYLYFNSSEIQKQIKKNTDQGSFFESLNVRGIKQLKVIMPHKDIMNDFEEKARILRKKIEVLNIENQYLIEVRDLLIKKLIR